MQEWLTCFAIVLLVSSVTAGSISTIVWLADHRPELGERIAKAVAILVGAFLLTAMVHDIRASYRQSHPVPAEAPQQ